MKKMEQTMLILLGFKLLRERNEAEKHELEGKIVGAQQEVLDLHNQIRATEVQNRKTLQIKERELNKLQMELILANQRKGTLEQQLQSYEIIKGERNLLKLN